MTVGKNKNKLTKWDEWLDQIDKDITALSVARHIYSEVKEIIDANPKIQIASSFYDYMTYTYATYMVMGIRRQIDADRRSISFVSLLEEIIRDPQILTRDWYVARYRDTVLSEKTAHRGFDQFSGEVKTHVDPAIVCEDIRQIKDKAENLRKFVNKRVAHHDRSEFKSLPTYKEIDNCLKFMEELLRKYRRFIHGSCPSSFLPTCQYDWKKIFREPWIPKSTN